MIRRYHTVRDFFDGATSMRECVDAHFRKPYDQGFGTHDVWNYWHVPGLYTLLRALPERVIRPALMDSFVRHLQTWSLENLGTVALTSPQLHMYVDGCGQDLHNDFHNGLWAYVFSLTLWDRGKFSGGETQLMRDGTFNHKPHHVHGGVLYDLIPAHFGQLLIFDDSIVHGVRPLHGTMDPAEGRIVLTGHIGFTNPIVDGALPSSVVRQWLRTWSPSLMWELRTHENVRGWLSCAIDVNADGSVREVATRGNQLVSTVNDDRAVIAATDAITGFLRRSRFPLSNGDSRIVLPLLVPVPNLKPISIQKTHRLCPAEAQQRLEKAFPKFAVTGTWDRNICQLAIAFPWCSGLLEVHLENVTVSVDLLMARPSHYADLEALLTDLLSEALGSDAAN